LIAQGIGNIASVLFGGIPATGALARTSANVQLGAQTPVAGMTHAVTLFVLMALFAPFASLMPLPALAAILGFVAWNMLELKHVFELIRTSYIDGLILLITAAITITVDITAAVQTGVLLSTILFLKKMRESATGRILVELDEKKTEQGELPPVVTPCGVTIFDLEGPYFFAISDLLNELMEQVEHRPKVLIIRLRAVPFIDSSGLSAINRFTHYWEKQGVTILFVEGRSELVKSLLKLQLPAKTGELPYASSLTQGLEHAKRLLDTSSITESTDIALLGTSS
jgi:SulP family sulfate permease